MPHSHNIVRVSGVTKSFQLRKLAVEALRGVDLEIRAGEYLSIMGPSGSGKTTLFNIMMNLLEPDQGDIILDRIPIRFGDFAYKKDIGYAPETPALYEYLTGTEFLNFVAAAKEIPSTIREKEIQQWMSFFKLEEKSNELIVNFSHGMRRKLSLCAALLGEPKLLLLDEPSLGLAPKLVQSVFETIKQINSQGTTILLVEQNAFAALHIADRGYVMENGQIVHSGLAKDLVSDKKVKEAYLGG